MPQTLPFKETFISTDVPERLCICALDLDLDQSFMPSTKDLVVHADTVRIPASLKCLSQNLEIYARRLEIAEGVTIELSGAKARSYQGASDRANSGTSPGADGVNGLAGGAGQSGGSLRIACESVVGKIHLISNGSDGGRGQDGGDGKVGKEGPKGRDNFPGTDGYHPGGVGGTGGTGGAAGAAGDSGSGGNAGSLFVYTAEALPDFQCDASPGKAAPAAKGGKPGEGGPGGKGGMGQTCGWTNPLGMPLRDNPQKFAEAMDAALMASRRIGSVLRPGDIGPLPRFRCSTIGPAAQGSKGKSGKSAQSPKTGVDGSNGAVKREQVDYAVMQANCTLAQLLMIEASAELAYQNRDYADAYKRFGWIRNTTSHPVALLDDTVSGLPAEAGATPGQPTNEVLALNERARRFLSQLDRSLDYFGRSRDYVSLVSLGHYAQYIELQLNLAQKVEDEYLKYLDASADQAAQKRAMLGAISSATLAIQRSQSNIRQLVAESRDLEAALAHLDLSVEQTQEEVEKADKAFQDAVADRADCSFLDVLRAMVNVIVIGANAYASVLAISESLDAIEKLKDDDNAGLIKQLQIVGKELQSLPTAYGKIKDMIDDATHPNSAKIIMTEEEFNETIAPYNQMPEAREYKLLVNRFFRIVKARNTVVLKYDATTRMRALAEVELKQSEQALAELRNAQASSVNPALPAVAARLNRLHRQVRQELTRALFEEIRALEYWGLAEVDVNILPRSIAELGMTHSTVLAETMRQRETIGRAQPFGRALAPVDIELRQSDDPESFERFRQSGLLIVEIPLDAAGFAGMRHVLVDQVTARIDGAKTGDGWLRVRMLHNGSAKIRDRAGRDWSFSHLPVPAAYHYSLSSPDVQLDGNLAWEQSVYSGVSPFASWSIIVDKSDNPKLNLKDVKKITLSFAGRCLSR